MLFEGAMGVYPDFVEPMNGARTNINYHVIASNTSYAMRIPGEGTNGYIDRSCEIANLRKVSKTFDFVPDVLYADAETGLLVCEYLTGARGLSLEDTGNDNVIAGTAGRLAQLHFSRLKFGNIFDLSRTKARYQELLDSTGYELPTDIVRNSSALEAALTEYEGRYGKRLAPCHIDPNMANFMERDGAYFLVDWEYSGMCNPLFDVANMVMTDCLNEVAEGRFLRAYEEASEVDINKEEYLLIKVAADYMWLFWHLIKLSQGQMVEYNEFSWRNRLNRALGNLRKLG